MTDRASYPRTAIVLGAGASAAEGAPLQTALFREFSSCISRQRSQRANSNIQAFFGDFFGFDIRDPGAESHNFPTFEEVLGILEIADSQEDCFRSATRRSWDTARIQKTRQDLILLIAEVLERKLQSEGKHHRLLLQNLGRQGRLGQTLFLSLNYDIVIDNSLLDLYTRPRAGWDLDYGIDFTNVEMVGHAPEAQWHRPNPRKSILLLKLHGSLNWLYCPTCRALTLTPKEKRVCRLKWRPEDCRCKECKGLSVPIIIPPTFFKVMSNFYLQQIWKRAEDELKQAERIIFCGYSFPDADIHIKYLLKRAEVNRPDGQGPPEVFIVNEHEGKADGQRTMERERYMRFFKQKNRVHLTNRSFEEFAADPQLIEDQTRWW